MVDFSTFSTEKITPESIRHLEELLTETIEKFLLQQGWKMDREGLWFKGVYISLTDGQAFWREENNLKTGESFT